ncbi:MULTISPECIES: hypothetical protein [Thermomonosporaceae]|uniref:hypothetical protein n=1 Tax=Thermomonosporaceae TaxID=2012 RepID=UPI00255B3185|nr:MULTISPECIES: hypothetical protein [Thermomonosporaceae]MDL4774241.1 hypothetical protein [Actinomadura xylanilytica]
MTPYGLIHQQSLDPAFTTPPPNLTYCPVRQQTLANGVPLAAQPDLLQAYSVTWGTTDKDNKTDAGG